MLKTENLCFRYGDSPILQNITLSVPAGEVVTLLGPNGSGKTTLIKCLTGVLQPDEGSVKVEEQNLAALHPKQIAQLIAVLFQNHVPAFPYKVKDLVLMGRAPYIDGILSNPGRQDYAIIGQIMDDLHIKKFAERPYTALSGGERQLVLLARALAQQPKILVLDEPTAPLDFKNTITVLNKVRQLAKEQELTVILSLHDPNHALLFSDKVALIKEGRLLSFGAAEEIVTNDNLAMLYDVDVELIKRFTVAKR